MVDGNSETMTNSSFWISSDNNDFTIISTKFEAYHTNPINVLIHLITTPLGILGFLALVKWFFRSTSAAGFLCALYVISLLPLIQLGVFAGTLLVCCSLLLLARQMSLGLLSSVSIIVIAYLLQDASHLVTGEKTFQSSYSAGGQVKCLALLEIII